MKNITFIGMGVMGAPMAGHVAKAGYAVTVYNRTHDKALEWVKTYGGKAADNLQDAVSQAEVVLMCLGNDQSVEETLLGDEAGNGGAFFAMKAGAIIVDNTTTSAKLAMRLADEANKKQLYFLDAPVSGGEVGAQNGALTVMIGGDSAAFERAKPIVKTYSRAVTRIGESGSGQLAKMVNQICIAGLVQGLSEALAFSEKAGLDSKLVLDVISKGAAQSWQMENRGKTMVDNQFEFGFAVDHMRKDLGLCIEQAKAIGAELPIARIVDEFYAEVQSKGGARWDTSSLITRLP